MCQTSILLIIITFWQECLLRQRLSSSSAQNGKKIANISQALLALLDEWHGDGCNLLAAKQAASLSASPIVGWLAG